MHSPIATYLTETLESVASDTSGELANYIPELAAGEPDGPHEAAAAFAFGWATRWARAKRLICSAVGYAKDTFTSPLTSMSGRTSMPFISICSATGAHSSNAEG